MRCKIILVFLFLIPGMQAFGETWPPEVTVDQTVMIIYQLQGGNAHIRRQGTSYTIKPFDSQQRTKNNQRLVRLAVADRDRFWLDQNATAQASFIAANGDVGAIQTIGKEFHEADTASYKQYKTLTSAQEHRVRLLLCSAANSKPITDLTRPGLALPLKDSLVRASVIPYWFWEAHGSTASKVTLVYVLNEGQIDLGSWTVSGKPHGSLAIDREALIEKLRQRFGEAEDWNNKPIPIRMRLTDSREKTYEVDIKLVDAQSDSEASQKLVLLTEMLKEQSGDSRDLKITQLLSDLWTFPSEALHLLAQTPPDPRIKALLITLGEQMGVEPKAFLPRK